MIAHVAGEPAATREDNRMRQRCTRCGAVLSDGVGGEFPWYPGQVIGVSDNRMVRQPLPAGHDHPECTGKEQEDGRTMVHE